MRKRIETVLDVELKKLTTLFVITMLSLLCFVTVSVYKCSLDSYDNNVNREVLSEFIRWETQEYYFDKAAETENIVCTSKTTDEMLDRYTSWKLCNYDISSIKKCTPSKSHVDLLFVTAYQHFIEGREDVLNSRIKKTILDSIYSDLSKTYLCLEDDCIDAVDMMHSTYIELSSSIKHVYKKIAPIEEYKDICSIMQIVSFVVTVFGFLHIVYVNLLIDKINQAMVTPTRKSKKIEDKENL